MDAQVKGNTVTFLGALDERASEQNIATCLEIAREATLKPGTEAGSDGEGMEPVRVDFSRVGRANSAGLLTLQKALARTGVEVCYVNAPLWLVDNFNYGEGASSSSRNMQLRVESFQAPFFCEKTGACELVTLVIGKDVVCKKDQAVLQGTFATIQGEELEPDFDEQEYFLFIRKRIA